MAFQGAFATIEDFRHRLGITAETLSALDTSAITKLLEDTSGVIERAAGRRLRRLHSATEYFPGGKPTIRTNMSHIIKIHSIRESYLRDFTDSDNYEELVEGTDYAIETSQGGEAVGASGTIRRLSGDWMGSPSSPGQVQVAYTAGFKTDQEAALEGVDTVFNSSDQIANYRLRKNVSEYEYHSPNSGELSVYNDVVSGGTEHSHAILRLDTDGVILPTWLITSINIVAYLKRIGLPDPQEISLLTFSDPDAISSDLSAISDAIDDADVVAILPDGETAPRFAGVLAALSATNDTYTEFSTAVEDQSTIGWFSRQIQDGYLCFAFDNAETPTANPIETRLAAMDYSDSAKRPIVTVSHQPLIHSDKFDVPYDLRNACLLQAVHEFQTRRSPGYESQSARGVAIASGASYQKGAAELLPEVLAVAKSYRRIV